MQEVQQVYALLRQKKKIVITTHQKPDGDAMGAALGLYHFLNKLGHAVAVISPTNWASFLNWMPGCNTVIDYEAEKEEAEKIICDADLDYLGRSDFYSTGEGLFKEFLRQGIVQDETSWNLLQVNFLERHHYFTQTCQRKREAIKQQHLEELRKKTAVNS